METAITEIKGHNCDGEELTIFIETSFSEDGLLIDVINGWDNNRIISTITPYSDLETDIETARKSIE